MVENRHVPDNDRGVQMKKTISAALAAAMLGLPAHADVKIGFVTTLTTPAAIIGIDQKNAVDLAMEHLGGMAGDTKLEVIYGDDQFAPEAGKQVTDKLVQQDNVDFVAGYIWSHVLLASRKSVLDADKILISANAGPSQMAGKLCDKNFYSTSWQNDQTPMAMGEVLNRQGVKSLYIMAPNYAAARSALPPAFRAAAIFSGAISRSRIQSGPRRAKTTVPPWS